MKKPSSAFFQFLEDPHTPIAELQSELEQVGAPVFSLERRVRDILERNKPPAVARDWIRTARAAQKKFENRLRAKKTWISDRFKTVQELADAIKSGELGLGLQTQAQVYFRDQDLTKISEQDFRSFVRDREILAELEGSDDEVGSGHA